MKGPRPQPGRQTEFFSHSADIVGYGGSAGSGKSWVLRNHHWYVLEFEDQRWRRGEIKQSTAWCAYFRRVTPNFQQMSAQAHVELQQIDPEVKWNQNDHIFTYPCGLRVKYGAMDRKTDYLKFQSWEFIDVSWDELTEFEEDQFDFITYGRIRSGDPALRRFQSTRWGSNPVGPGLLWVRRRFVDPYKAHGVPFGTTFRVQKKLDDGRIVERDQVFIQAFLADNQILDADGTYRAGLMSAKPHIAKPLLEGNWYYASGGLLSEYWREDYHVCDTHRIPPNVFRFRSQDFGINEPCSTTWWYVDADGAMTAYYNLYVKNMTADKIAGAIKEIETYFGDWDQENNRSMLRRSPLDAKCWARSGTSGPTIAQEYARHGVFWVESIKDRFNGIAEVCRRLDQFIDLRTGQVIAKQDLPPAAHVKPMIRWMRRCEIPRTILPVLAQDPNNPGDVAPHSEDHVLDDTMYACGSHPLKPVLKSVPNDSEDDAEREYKRRYRSRGTLVRIVR